MKNTFFLLTLLACGFVFPYKSFAQAPTDKQLQAIDKIMAPQRKRVMEILEADKTGQYKIYKADLEAFAKAKSPEQQAEHATQMDRDHKVFVQAAFKAAKIDLTALKRQVAGILGNSKFTMDEFGGISNESFLPLGPIPQRFMVELSCPFHVFQDQTNQTLVSNCSGFANDCKLSTTAITEFDGGCRSKAWTGDKFELPDGNFQKITVSAQFDAKALGFAFAIVGYGKAESKFGLRLQGPGFDQLAIVKEVWCLAPVIWFKRFEFEATDFQAQVVFTGAFTGGNSFTAQVYNESHAIAVPALDAGAADSSADTFDFIQIVATN